MLPKPKYQVEISFSHDFGHNTIHGICKVGYDTVEVSYSYNKMTFSELGEKMKEISIQLEEKAKILENLKRLK